MTDTTTQPDPLVVARMRKHLRAHPSTTLGRLMADLPEGITRDEFDRAYNAARKPLTVADIPAGQGAASLFLIDGHEATVWFKAHDGRLAPVAIDGPQYRTEVRALWEHLAATLLTVTDATEEADLSPLFDTPQIHTDTDGQHRDDTGREYRAVDVGGELTYQPTDSDTIEEST